MNNANPINSSDTRADYMARVEAMTSEFNQKFNALQRELGIDPDADPNPVRGPEHGPSLFQLQQDDGTHNGRATMTSRQNNEEENTETEGSSPTSELEDYRWEPSMSSGEETNHANGNNQGIQPDVSYQRRMIWEPSMSSGEGSSNNRNIQWNAGVEQEANEEAIGGGFSRPMSGSFGYAPRRVV